jgi:hypothetical protein
MFEQVRAALSAGHIALVLLGVVLTAGIAWGTGTSRIEEHDRAIVDLKGRVGAVEATQREDIRDMRKEMNDRFNSLESILRKTAQ